MKGGGVASSMLVLWSMETNAATWVDRLTHTSGAQPFNPRNSSFNTNQSLCVCLRAYLFFAVSTLNPEPSALKRFALIITPLGLICPTADKKAFTYEIGNSCSELGNKCQYKQILSVCLWQLIKKPIMGCPSFNQFVIYYYKFMGSSSAFKVTNKIKGKSMKSLQSIAFKMKYY